MSKLINNRPLLAGSVVSFTLFLAATLVLPMGFLILTLNALLIVIAIIVISTYSPAMVDIIYQTTPMDRTDKLTTGIFLSWLAVLITRGWITIIRMDATRPMQDSAIVAFYLYLAVLAGALHVYAAPRKLPGRRWRSPIIIGLVIIAGLLIGHLISFFIGRN